MNTTVDTRTEIKWVTQDNKLVPYADAKISVMAPGLTFAALVFEGYRAYWSDDAQDLYIFRLDDHMRRLAFSMNLLELDDPPSIDTFTRDILETLKANDFKEDTYIRLQVYVDEWGSMLATGPVGSTVICRPRPRVADFKTGKRFIVSSWRRNAENASPPRIKASANYLNSRLAGLEAKRQGAGGAILLNEDGTVSEGPGGCLFVLRDGVFATPDVTSGILESVTRRTILAAPNFILRTRLSIAGRGKKSCRSLRLTAGQSEKACRAWLHVVCKLPLMTSFEAGTTLTEIV